MLLNTSLFERMCCGKEEHKSWIFSFLLIVVKIVSDRDFKTEKICFQVYVGLLSTFLLLWLHPALGEGRGGRGGEGSFADQGGEDGELGSGEEVGRPCQ